jgi:hypothetical protein
MPATEPRNPFYFLLLIASVVFVATALAYTFVPFLEQKAAERGEPPPPSMLREALSTQGWKWLLYELAAMIVFAVLSMGLDRLRSLKKFEIRNSKSETNSNEQENSKTKNEEH